VEKQRECIGGVSAGEVLGRQRSAGNVTQALRLCASGLRRARRGCGAVLSGSADLHVDWSASGQSRE
jgi:hypothetical protein